VLIRDQDVLYATETNDYDGSIYISQIGRSASSRQLLSFGFCVSNWELGTWLVDFRQTIRVLLTPDMAIDYDEDSRTLVLRSKKRDANHASRYWLLNLRRYASTLSHRVPAATAGGPDALKELTSEP
jgi:hypothetical protein